VIEPNFTFYFTFDSLPRLTPADADAVAANINGPRQDIRSH